MSGKPMKAKNRKKLATIKEKIANGMLSAESRNDPEYGAALEILTEAINKVERIYGDVD